MADLSLDGLATGMSTGDTINKILNAQYGPKLQNLSEEKNSLETEKNAWRDVNSRINKLENKLTDLKLSSTFESNKTTSSNEDLATATATSDATTGSYDIEIIQTAQNQRIAGDKLSDSKTKLSELFASFPASSNVMIDGESIEITGEDTLSTVKDKINESGAGANASIVDNHLVLESSKTGTKNELGLIDNNNVLEKLGVLQSGADDSLLQSAPQGSSTTELGYTGSFKITAGGNTEEVALADTDTLNDLADKLNNLTNVNISADATGGVLTIDETGGNPIQLENTSLDGDDNIIKNLKLGNKAIKDELQSTRNAEVNVNGITGVTSQSNSFDEVISGVSFSLDTSLDIVSGDPTENVTIDVNRNVSKATSAIQDFVDQYNSVQDFISTKQNYDPETEEAGALQGDGTLMRLQSKLRQMVTNNVGGNEKYDQLAMVGIEINKDGVMSFNSSEFRDALEDRPEEVKKLFQANTDDNSFDGVATRLDSYLDVLVQSNTGVIPEKIDSYETMVDRVENNVDSTQDRLTQEKERLQEEFTAMETAISEMNSQMSWMQNQLNSLGSSSLTSML